MTVKKKAGFVPDEAKTEDMELPVEIWLTAVEANKLIKDEGYMLAEISEHGYKVVKN